MQQSIIESVGFGLYLMCFNAVVLLLFLNALDDAFVDAVYIARRIYRAIVVKPRYRTASAASMRALRTKQKALAICVPAWEEEAVIAQMLQRAVRTVRYDNYRIFVGVYANDPDTRKAIETLCARDHDCAHRVVIVTHDAKGPTSKADCLNSIYQHITQSDAWAEAEKVHGFILHDAEDIVHPSELVVFNHLIGRADIIQLPVTPLVRPLSHLIGGHYIDEFAESHTKDLVVRETLGAPLPSAGVGCAFSAEALQSLAMVRGGAPFNTRSVTEDYDIAFDMADLGFRSMFVRLPSHSGDASFVATQEYFPNTFIAAVRQKGRWLLGIALENCDRRGWHGNWASRYMLWRDRKALLTAFAAIAAYALIIVFLAMAWLTETPLEDLYSRIVPAGGIVAFLLWANLLFLANRLLQRFAFVYRCYGLTQALMSPLRVVVGNFVNFAAALRAAWLFRKSLKNNTASHWYKTTHQIPTADAALKMPGGR
ncbi:MAG: glycosyl transferase family protein [Pseudomonadota bacterium]